MNQPKHPVRLTVVPLASLLNLLSLPVFFAGSDTVLLLEELMHVCTSAVQTTPHPMAGQRFRQGAWGCFRAMHPALSGIGGASLVVSFLVGLYYNVIICYCKL